MKTRCPTCKTRYDIPPQALLEADGLARCFRCGTVFETVSEDTGIPGVIYPGQAEHAATLDEQSETPHDVAWEPQDPDIAPASAEERTGEAFEPQPADARFEDTPPPVSPAAEVAPAAADPVGDHSEQAVEAQTPRSTDQHEATQSSETAAHPLPFDVPDDLEPLEPSPDVALDISDTLYEKKSYRGVYYGLAAVLLAAGLGLQLVWQHRKELVQEYPILEPLCEHIECLPSVIHAPEKMSVLQRDIAPTANQPGSLTLSAKIRNDADTAQSLPDIQLSLLDDNGAVLIRRRLAPTEYLFPPPSKGKLLAPGEVVTIAVDFMDPGHQASGFLIGFL